MAGVGALWERIESSIQVDSLGVRKSRLEPDRNFVWF